MTLSFAQEPWGPGRWADTRMVFALQPGGGKFGMVLRVYPTVSQFQQYSKLYTLRLYKVIKVSYMCMYMHMLCLPLRFSKGFSTCAEDSCCALNRLQWVTDCRNGLTLTTADDYNSKVLSERGGAGQRVGYTKIGPRASPNRITQNHCVSSHVITCCILG